MFHNYHKIYSFILVMIFSALYNLCRYTHKVSNTICIYRCIWYLNYVSVFIYLNSFKRSIFLKHFTATCIISILKLITGKSYTMTYKVLTMVIWLIKKKKLLVINNKNILYACQFSYLNIFISLIFTSY
jgi:hypothetical protein